MLSSFAPGAVKDSELGDGHARLAGVRDNTIWNRRRHKDSGIGEEERRKHNKESVSGREEAENTTKRQYQGERKKMKTTK